MVSIHSDNIYVLFMCSEKINTSDSIMIKTIIFLSLLIVGSASNYTDHLSERFNHYDDIVHESFDSLGIFTGSSGTACEFCRACPANSTFGTFCDADLAMDARFNNEYVDLSRVIFKESVSDQTVDSDLQRHICAMNNMQPVLEDNLNNDEEGLKWQYFGFVDGAFASYPFVNWTDINQCPGSYQPEQRPWFNSGSAGMKDLAILVDVSKSTPNSESRLSLKKEIAIKFIDSLAFRDFVTIIPYSSYTTPYDSSVMARADSENKEYLKSFIEDLELHDTESTNIGAAVVDALEIFESSSEAGETSECTKVIVLLTGGENSMTSIDPMEEIESSGMDPMPMVFSYVINHNENYESAILTPSELACETGGIVQLFSGEFDVGEPLESFSRYMAAGVENTEVLWSEIYEDAMGLGQMTSGCRPYYEEDGEGVKILVGVFCIDVTLDSLDNNGTISEEEILTYIMTNQKCEKFSANKDIKSLYMDTNICESFASESDIPKPDYVKAYGGIVAAMVIAILAMGIIIPVYSSTKGMDCSCGLIVMGVLIIIPFGLWFLCTMFLMLWDEIVRYHTYMEAAMTVEKKEENPYTCCDIVNCQCANANGRPTCSSMKASKTEGTCDNGYYCCRHTSYSCNCRQSCSYSSSYGSSCRTVCSTCYRCVSSVNHQKCEVKCGTCYTPTTTYSFLDYEGDLISASLQDSCGRDDYGCVTDFFNESPNVGGTVDMFYDPYDTSQISETIDYSAPALGATLTPAIIILGLFITMLVIFFRRLCC